MKTEIEWISVYKDLPSFGFKLVANKRGFVRVAERLNGHWRIGRHIMKEVTYWADLPKHPDTEGHE